MKRFYLLLMLAGLLSLCACGTGLKQEVARTGAVSVRTEEGEASSLEIRNITLTEYVGTVGPHVVIGSDGKAARVDLEGPSDLLEEIKVEFSGRQLKISGDASVCYRITEDLTVRLLNYDFETLHFAGACRVEAETILGVPSPQETAGRKLEIKMSGASSLTALTIRTGSLVMDFSGASTFTAGLIECDTWKQDVSGASTLTVSECHVTGDTTWNASGASRLTAAGQGKDLYAVLSGASVVSAPDCEFVKATLTLSGAATLDCWVTQLLGGSITGGSSVYYKGDPSLAAHTGSSSRLEKR